MLSVKVIAKRASAFIAYADRDGAEKAAAEVGGRFELNGKSLRLDWSKRAEGTVLEGDSERKDPAQAPGPGLS